MAFRWRWILILLVAFAATGRLFAAAPEDRAFGDASKSFQDTFYARAEREFAAFVQQFPTSPRIPEAVLFEAEARLMQTNYSGALELLMANQATAGSLAPEYLFWVGEVCLRSGDLKRAQATFGQLVKEYPGSSRYLEAVLKQAQAAARMADWTVVRELLHQTNGAFQSAARQDPGSELVFRGHMLLAEAQLAANDFNGAEDSLRPFEKRLLSPTNAWHWQYLLCRIQLAANKPQQALDSTSNLLAMAGNAQDPDLQARSFAFKGGVLENLGRLEEAMATYTNNLVGGISSDRQREALVRITELALKLNRLGEAARILDSFIARYPQAPSADLALLTLGELRLRQEQDARLARDLGTTTNAPTNSLALAQAAFEMLAKKSPDSALYGRSQLGLGWCFWFQTNLAESQKAFQNAVARLSPASLDLAVAHFKLGDVQFKLNDFDGAITNYQAVQDFAAQPAIETNLCEFALYQIVRAGLAAGNLTAVTGALSRILEWYPNGFHSGYAVLLAGQAYGKKGRQEEARNLFLDSIKAAPDSGLRPELELAIARSYEEQGAWTNAIEQYDFWLASYTNHQARARAEYSRATAYYHCHDETNALAGLTNFIARFPTNPLAPLAQWQMADAQFRNSAFARAENDFQVLAANWPGSELAFQAKMMAGRAAVGRLSWDNAAKYYFLPLWNDTNCPTHLRYQALFAYGDALMSQDSTNKVEDYQEAFKAYDKICQTYSTNQLATLAWGAKAICLLQWAKSAFQLTNAAQAFQAVLTNAPKASVVARSAATIGLGVVIEKQAKESAVAEQALFRRQALDYYLDVFYQTVVPEGEPPDAFWTKKAGLEAGRLASELGEWAQAERVYERLAELFPELRPSLQGPLHKAQENLARAAN
jgi:TolA-binding protein